MSASDKNAGRRVTDGVPRRLELGNTRMLVCMRCILAFSALLIIFIDPSEPARHVTLTYFSLIIYCAYSISLALISFSRGWPTPARFIHWLDVLFFSGLITLTEGTSSIFFHFFLFSILVASFSFGYREGLLVTVASVLSFLTVGILSAPSGAEFELNRTLIRPVYLATLGYMIAYWGGYEILLVRRLRLLQEVSNIWHPRFGVDHTMCIGLDRLREFYSADLCLLVLKRPTDPVTYWVFTASPTKPAHTTVPMQVTLEIATPLLCLLETQAATYRDRPRLWPGMGGRCLVYDVKIGRAHV